MSLLVVLPAQAVAPSLHFTADALPTWQTNGTVWSMAAAQGKVYAGGSFTQVRPPGTVEGAVGSLDRAQFAVFDAATGSPTSCVLDVTRGTTTAVVRAVATSSDGSTVYIGGLFERVGTSARKNIAAIDVATCTVKPFNPQPSSFVYAIAATADSVYFGGNFASVGGQTRSRLGAATPDGVVLPWAPTTDDEEFAIAVDPTTGNVILGGRSGTINGQDSHALGIVDGVTGTTNIKNYPKGFFPWTPGTGQRSGTSVVKAIAVDPNGFYVGNEGTGGGIFDGRAAFDWGTYSQRWRHLCLGATQSIAPVDGLLYSASHGHNCEAEGLFEDGARHFFSAETAATEQVQPWWPQANDGIGEGIGPRSIVSASTASGDFLWTGGEFTLINGVAQRGLTRFGQGPDTGAPATPQTPNVDSTSPGQATITWRTTLDADDKTLTYTLYRGTSATPIATLQGDSQFYSRPQLTFTDTGLTPGTTYQYRVKASDGTNVSAYSLFRTVAVAATAPAYPSTIRSDGAAVYFRMDEPSGTAAGSLGSGSLGGSYVNASTRTGQVGALVGSADTSASFDGVSSFLRTEVSTPAPTVYTIETWFKTTSVQGGKLVGYGNRAMMNAGTPIPLSSAFDRHVYLTNDGKAVFGVNSGGLRTISSAAGLNNGQWHQVVATQGPAGMVLYVDGLRVASNAVTGAQAFSGFWRIGGDNLANWPLRPTSNYFAGNIDETAIYDTALTAGQVQTHFTLATTAASPDSQAPTVPGGVSATASGANIGLSWTASIDNVGVARYEVHRSATPGFIPSATTKLADVTTGITYVDAGRPTGTWYYRVMAVDAAGNVSGLSNETSATVAVAPDTQAPTVPGGVSASVAGANVTVVWSASTDTVGVTGYEVHRSSTTGFTAGPTTKIADVTSGTTYTDVGRPIGNWFYRIVAVDAAGNASAGSTQASAAVADAIAPSVPANLAASVANQDVSLSWTPSTDNVGVTGYEVHRSATLGFTPSSATRIGTVAGTAFTDTVVTGGTWSYRVVAVDAAGNASAGSVQASAVVTAPADTQAPSVPAGLQAAAAGSTVALTWTASIDTVGVAGYDVHRSATSGFTPDVSTKVGTVSTGTSFSDVGRPVGTWYYRVVAVDASGNASGPSGEASAVVSGGAVQTVVLSPTEDSYAVQGLPTNNYGTSASMNSRGGSSSFTAYLKFALPAAPAGTTLVGATLSVRTTTDVAAGSADSHVVSMAPNSWTEAGLTWNTRPALGSPIGSFAPPTLPNTRYDAIVEASALSGLPAGDVSLALSSTSTDNMQIWSRNHAAVSFRPTLTLRYQAN